MASTPSSSTPGSKYDVTSRISELLDKYFSSMPPVSAPSAVFTSGPNQGLPVSAMPPSATPFRQKSGPRRVSKVTAETARARASRAARPAKQAERAAKNAPPPPTLFARADQTASDPSQLYKDPPMFPEGMTPEQLEKHMQESRERLSKSDTSPPKQPRPGPRPAPYSTRYLGTPSSAVQKLIDEAERMQRPRRWGTGLTPEQSSAAIADRDKELRRNQLSKDWLRMEDLADEISDRDKAGSSSIRERLRGINPDDRPEIFTPAPPGMTLEQEKAYRQQAVDEAVARQRATLEEMLSRVPKAETSVAQESPSYPSSYPDYVGQTLMEDLRRDREGREASRISAKLLRRDFADYPMPTLEIPEGAPFAGQGPGEVMGRISSVFSRLPIIRGLRDPSSIYYFPGKFY